MAIKSLNDPRYQAAIRRLVERRHELDLTQAKVARLLGRRQQFVGKYELLERRLDLLEYCDVAHALGLDGAVEILRIWKPN